jgi:hypothetical protein
MTWNYFLEKAIVLVNSFTVSYCVRTSIISLNYRRLYPLAVHLTGNLRPPLELYPAITGLL